MRFGLVLAILVFSSLPGCSSGPTTLTAMDARVVADREAEDWDEQAELVSIVSVEVGRDVPTSPGPDGNSTGGENGTDEDDGLDEVLQENGPDGSPGDGRARVWDVTYAAPNRTTYFHVVVDSGGVEDSYEVEQDEEEDNLLALEDGPVRDWVLDSDDAAEAAAEHNTSYAEMRGDDDVAALSYLAMGDEHPYWLLVLSREEENETVFLIVDAYNGNVTPFDFSLFFAGLFQVQQAGSETFTLNAAAAQQTGGFSINGAAVQQLVVDVHLDPALPLSEVRLTLTDPAGTVTPLAVATTPGVTTAEAFIQIVDVVPGTYSYEVALEGGVAQEVEVSFCTPGFGFPTILPSNAVAACEHLG